MDSFKKCSICKETKLLTEFCKKHASKDGRRPECKECQKNRPDVINIEKICQGCALLKNRDKYNIPSTGKMPSLCAECEKQNIPIQYKKCYRCEIVKNVSAFNNSKNERDGFTKICKQCASEINKQRAIQEKICQACATIKPRNDFTINKAKHMNAKCIECENNNIPISIKKCSKCNKIKTINHFSGGGNIKNNIDGYYAKCKECVAIENKEYKEEHKEELKLKQEVYIRDNIEIVRETRRKHINKKRNNISVRLRNNISGLIRKAIKSNGLSKNNLSIIHYLPYTINELIEHIESLFEPWMNWENWGIYDSKMHDTKPTWQLDHIIPQSLFNITSMSCQSFIDCWALSNLRPLDAKINLYDGIYRTRHKEHGAK